MKLDVVEFDLYLQHEWNIASMLHQPKEEGEPSKTVFLQLTDDDGVTGFGECPTSRRYGWTAEVIQNFLARIDPERLSFEKVDASMQYVMGLHPPVPAAWAGLNLALLDGAGKMHGLTVRKLMGVREPARAVTSFSIGIDSPDKVRDKLIEAAEYPVIKIKLGGPDDQAVMDLTREIVPEAIIRVDANEAWTTREEALEKIEWLHRQYPKVEFVEQPMPNNTPVKDCAWLKQRSALPLIADESFHNSNDLDFCLQGFHGINAKLVKTGGISEAFRSLKAAREMGLKTMLGCMIESSLFITAAAHLSGLADYLDLDGALLTSNDPVNGVRILNGELSWEGAPSTDGLQIDWRNPVFF